MRRLTQVGPAIAYAGLIFALSSFSSFPVPKEIWSFDKVIHGLEYAGFGYLVARAFGGRVGWAAIAAALYGVTDELHQSFVPGRSADVFDAVADAIGAAIGAAAFGFHSWRASRVK